MKPTAIPSVEAIPSHWEIRRTRMISDVRVSNVDKHSLDGEVPVLLCNYVDVYRNDRINNTLPFMAATATKEEISRFGLEEGDVIITKDSENWEDIGIATLVEEVRDNLVCGYHLAILRPESAALDSRFLRYSLNSIPVSYQLRVRANGVTRFGLSHEAIKSVWIPTPPSEEQERIADFLDHADGQIQRYIAAKERLIALLEEERQALVHQAVTRGLDPGVRLKPSGVEWLGEVPEGWDLARIKSVAQVRYGLGQPPPEKDGGLPLIRATNVSRGHILEHDMVYVDPQEVPQNREAFLSEGEIIVVRSGAYTADSAIISPQYEGAVTGYDMVLKPTGVLPKFLAMALLTRYLRDDQLIINSTRAAQPHLNAEELGSALVVLPPTEEQTNIAMYLDDITASLDAAVAQALRQIDLMNEYRTRLIADVVTGQLDVWEAAIELPTPPVEANLPENTVIAQEVLGR